MEDFPAFRTRFGHVVLRGLVMSREVGNAALRARRRAPLGNWTDARVEDEVRGLWIGRSGSNCMDGEEGSERWDDCLRG